jgi:hypothetical protein
MKLLAIAIIFIPCIQSWAGPMQLSAEAKMAQVKAMRNCLKTSTLTKLTNSFKYIGGLQINTLKIIFDTISYESLFFGINHSESKAIRYDGHQTIFSDIHGTILGDDGTSYAFMGYAEANFNNIFNSKQKLADGALIPKGIQDCSLEKLDARFSSSNNEIIDFKQQHECGNCFYSKNP